MTRPSSSASLALLASVDDLPPAALSLVERATPEEREALVEAIRSSYERGREEADRRSALQLARIFGSLVGMEPMVDRGSGDGRSLRERLVERFRRGG